MSGSPLMALPVEGNAESAVRVLAFEDLQCKDCAAWRRMLEKTLLPRVGDRVAFETRDYPREHHHWAEDAAVISRRMAEIGVERCLDFRRYCFEHMDQISAESFPEQVVAYAEEAGLDSEDISIAVRNEDFRQAVAEDVEEGRRLGIERTPTVMVGDLRFVEVFGVQEIIAAIENALKA